MTNSLEEQLQQLMDLIQTAEGEKQTTITRLVEAIDIVTKELARFRAWEAVLYLFFARHYTEKPNPIAAATSDRDFLADQRRAFAQDEAGAQDIIKLYDPIFTYINVGQEAMRLRGEGEEGDTIM